MRRISPFCWASRAGVFCEAGRSQALGVGVATVELTRGRLNRARSGAVPARVLPPIIRLPGASWATSPEADAGLPIFLRPAPFKIRVCWSPGAVARGRSIRAARSRRARSSVLPSRSDVSFPGNILHETASALRRHFRRRNATTPNHPPPQAPGDAGGGGGSGSRGGRTWNLGAHPGVSR